MLAIALLAATTGALGLRQPRYPWFFLLVALLAGAVCGTSAGSASRAACTASLEGGTPVIVLGTVEDRVPRLRPDGDANRASARLGGTTLVAAGRLCDAGALRTTLPLAEEAREAGTPVMAKGVWRRSGDARLPRAVDRYGYVSVTALDVVEPEGAPSHRASGGTRLRAALAARLERRLRTPELAAVGKALVLADKTTLERETRQRFIDAGIVHLLAISGLHVGMIAGALAWAIGRVETRPRRWAWAAVAVSAYVALIGAPPAATRAALVFWGHAYCRWRDGPARIADLAGVAGLVALAADPLLATDPGFQLSFAGFAGVLLGHRAGSGIADRIRGRGGQGARAARIRASAGSLADGMISSAGAFALTAPIAALHFGRVVATSIPASVASTGLVALAIPAVAATALLPGAAGEFAGYAASSLLAVLVAVADAFAGVPLRWRAPPAAGAWWTVAGLLVIALFKARRRRRPGYGLALTALVVAWLGRPAAARVAGVGTPLLCHLDIGQGDAAVVRTGEGRWLVFDAGPGTSVLDGRPLTEGDIRTGGWAGDAGRDVIVPFLRSRGAREIELLALSHPHLDHFGGSGALFERFRVRHVLDPGLAEPSAAYLAFLERVEEERAVWVRGMAGEGVTIDDVRIDILWPVPGDHVDANETSLSFRLEVGGISYVNTGDAPVETELAILERERPGSLEASILKLGHHGSRTSSAVAWLRAIDPEIAVMSLARDNRYGHPHAATLARLDSARVPRIWRTDRDGTLCVESRGTGWDVVRP